MRLGFWPARNWNPDRGRPSDMRTHRLPTLAVALPIILFIHGALGQPAGIFVDPATGDVGIGTKSPGARLQVEQNDKTGKPALLLENSNSYLLLPTSPTSNTNAITELRLRALSKRLFPTPPGHAPPAPSATQTTAHMRVEADNASKDHRLSLGTDGTVPIILDTNGIERLRIDEAG